jgi:ribosome-binding protein aMBF1 (putative translation factor)
MAKLSGMRKAADVKATSFKDSSVAVHAARMAFAHEVAIQVIAYRADRNLSQTALAKELGMQQPTIARLEAGEHEPSSTTLERLARVLGMEFQMAITQEIPVMHLVSVKVPKQPKSETKRRLVS